MPASYPAHYQELRSLCRTAALLKSTMSLLNWDQETYMPPAAGQIRSEQYSHLASLAHKAATDPRLGDLIGTCEGDQSLTGDPDSETARNLRELRRDFDRATRLPNELVAELAKVGSQAQEAWKEARANDDFKSFAPWLEKMIALTRRKAECYGVPASSNGGGELYDALLDEYEPGATAAEIEQIFTPLRERVSNLVADIAASKVKARTAILSAKIPAENQHTFGLFVIESMGFDLKAGRLDTTTHPFCSEFGPGDTRLTTRYRDEKFTDALYGTMHEMGHGLYEQGLPKAENYGFPIADAISLGIHESQSRMWENFVGRSKAFWKWALPKARKTLGGAKLKAATVDQLYAAVNTATPSYIRVEADEATYNLHVMLRFEIERALISGDLKVKDLPGTWNRKFESMLGIKVPDDKRGCLQDVHWSFGLIGYFPTYTLGNLYAAQFWEKINQDIKDLDKLIAKGDFAPLKKWLNKNIHSCGRRWRAGELCERITGKPLSADPLMRHLEGKLRPLYKV